MSDDELTKDMQVSESGNMIIAGFEFTPTRLIAHGDPTFEDWERVGIFLRYVDTGAQFWIGDWLNYGEPVYGEKYSQALEHTGYELSTLETYAWISRSVPPSNRKETIPFGYYSNGLAALSPSDQAMWIQRILDEKLKRGEFKTLLRASKRSATLANVTVPEGQFRVIYADNPWAYVDEGVITGESGAESYGKAERHYPTMTIEELIEFYAKTVASLAMANSVLFLWVPAPLLMENPGPREVIEAAGFTYKAGRVWNKQAHNYGHYVSVQHEHLLICTKGSCVPDRHTPMLNSVVSIKRSKTHSEKPDQFRKDIERLYDGPYLELFGRKPVDGWTVFGNDVSLVETSDVAVGQVTEDQTSVVP